MRGESDGLGSKNAVAVGALPRGLQHFCRGSELTARRELMDGYG
ncbi:MAG: hypothetical protein ACI382_02805 [Alloprevotella sp.]